MKVYIAGPYTQGDVAVNVRQAMMAGLEVMRYGHYPFIPHLFHFVHLVSPQDYSTWIELDLEFLPTCDALLRLPGPSKGADAEVIEARKLGMPVYASMAEFLEATA